jgi:hypothetical protein
MNDVVGPKKKRRRHNRKSLPQDGLHIAEDDQTPRQIAAFYGDAVSSAGMFFETLTYKYYIISFIHFFFFLLFSFFFFLFSFFFFLFSFFSFSFLFC